MKTVDPRKGRATVTAGAGDLQITIPARKPILLILFLGLWAIGWIVLGAFAISQFFVGMVVNPPPVPVILFVVVWSLVWLLSSIYVVSMLAWMLWGREVVVVESGGLVHRRIVFGLGPTRRYNLAQMRRLRVKPEITAGWGMRRGPFSAAGQMFGISGGSLAFDYGMKTPHFGAALDDAEAEYLRHEICERVPTICDGGSARA